MPYFKGVSSTKQSDLPNEIADKIYENFIEQLNSKTPKSQYEKEEISKQKAVFEENEEETKRVFGLLYNGLKKSYDRGEVKKEYGRNWEPAITREEAELFINNSNIQNTLYRTSGSPELHKKNGYTLDRVGVLYPGVYFAKTKQDAKLYGENVVSVKVYSKNETSYNMFKIRKNSIIERSTDNADLKNALESMAGVLDNVLAKQFNIDAFTDTKEVFDDMCEYYAIVDPKNIVIINE